jgi:hypothetical protein
VFERRTPNKREQREQRKRSGKRSSQQAEKGAVKALGIAIGLFCIVTLALLVLVFYALN